MGRCDVAHLDRFLSSLWGKKLFSHKKAQRRQPREGLFCTTKGTPAFLATSRDIACPSSFNSQQLHLTVRPEPVHKDLYSLSRRMEHLATRIEVQEQRSRGLLSPIKSRCLTISCRRLREEYNGLKAQKMQETKQTRVYKHWYPRGQADVKPLSNTYRDSLFHKYRDADTGEPFTQTRKTLLRSHRDYDIISGLVHNS